MLVLTCCVGRNAGFDLLCRVQCWFLLAVSITMLVLTCCVGHNDYLYRLCGPCDTCGTVSGFSVQCVGVVTSPDDRLTSLL